MTILIILAILIIIAMFLYRHDSKNKKKPETLRKWTTIYYGERGSCKTLHQAKVILQYMEYLDWLYKQPKNKNLHHSIVYTIQKFSPAIEKKYAYWTYGSKQETKADGSTHEVIDFSNRQLNNPKGYLYYWNDAKDLQYCPRYVCWKGKQKHRLHGCLLVFDDMATILPSQNWQHTPVWMQKMFAQARHFGIRILANMQDPFSVDVNFRRYCDVAFRFNKIIGSRDPDETLPPVKHIWGWYVRRKIKASLLWEMGDMSEEEISVMKARQKREQEVTGKHFYSGIWKSSLHWIGKDVCSLYDTTQDVPEYIPAGYSHQELHCIDPKHDHINEDADNYCDYKKVTHQLI